MDAMIGCLQLLTRVVFFHTTYDHFWVILSKPFCVHVYAKENIRCSN